MVPRGIFCGLQRVHLAQLSRKGALGQRMGGAASFFWGSNSTDDKVDMNSQAAKVVQGKIKDNCVVMFSKTTCSFCRMAKDVLNETGATYDVVELNQVEHGDEYADVLLAMTGARTVPRVFINGKCIGGGSETRDLHRQGKLVPLIQECGISVSSPQSKM